MTSPRGSATPLDLRGVADRQVHRDDAVIITGAEYLAKTMAANEVRERDAAIAGLEAQVEILERQLQADYRKGRL